MFWDNRWSDLLHCMDVQKHFNGLAGGESNYFYKLTRHRGTAELGDGDVLVGNIKI